MSDQNYMPGFDVGEPTEDEMKKTIESLRKKYDIIISEEDAVEYTKLSQEFEQWFLIEKDIDSPDSIIENVAKRIKDHAKQALNQEITIEDARTFAHKIAGANIPDEKERIATNMRAIIKKYQ